MVGLSMKAAAAIGLEQQRQQRQHGAAGQLAAVVDRLQLGGAVHLRHQLDGVRRRRGQHGDAVLPLQRRRLGRDDRPLFEALVRSLALFIRRLDVIQSVRATLLQ